MLPYPGRDIETVQFTIFILDGNSAHGAHVFRKIGLYDIKFLPVDLNKCHDQIIFFLVSFEYK